MTPSEITARLDFVRAAERLKCVLRSGFTSSGRPESTPEHSWRLCLLVMAFHDQMPQLDLARLLQLCVVHDLGEALRGDVPAPQQAGSKSEGERADLQQLLQTLPAALQQQMLDLWDEYDQAASPEAVAVKAFDKLETLLQHTQGANPPDFDYAFNLHYGSRYTAATPLLQAIRAQVDEATRARMHEATAHATGPADGAAATAPAGRAGR